MFAAVCASAAFMGCGDDDDDSANSAGSGGSSAGTGGSSNGGKAGSATAGSATAGSATGGNTSAGSGGKAGASTGGNAGTSAGGKAGGGSGGSTVVAGSDAGGAGGASDCMEAEIGGAGSLDEGAGGGAGAPSVETAVVLLDNVVVKNGAAVVKTWAFATGEDILDAAVGNVGDKWLRPPFDTGADNVAYSSPFAHDVFAKCDGKPAGSLLNIVPFVKAAQYYKLSIGFAQADWSGYVITADVKLVSGGNLEGACRANAALFVQDGAGANAGAAVQLNPGEWKSATFTVPASTMVDHLSINISDYTCL
jgi:hypothetical protein